MISSIFNAIKKISFVVPQKTLSYAQERIIKKGTYPIV